MHHYVRVSSYRGGEVSIDIKIKSEMVPLVRGGVLYYKILGGF